ncbi:Hypothetical protein FKW44_006840, partial [Caligus rogercresseyi]
MDSIRYNIIHPKPSGPACRYGLLFKVEPHCQLWQGIKRGLTFNRIHPKPS